jgi:UDP-glucose 4-epimerase
MMANNKVLVLGANGFIGKHLCIALQESGAAVRGVDLKFAADELTGVEKIEGNFSDKDFINEVLVGCDTVYHLISTTIPSTSVTDPYCDGETNILPTIQLLTAAVEAGIKTVVFASSGGTVYGIPSEIPVKETARNNPICPYGIHKLAIEKYLHFYSYAYGLKTVALRLSNPYGQIQRKSNLQGAVDVFVNNALHNKPIEIWGDGTVARDYIHISDVIRAFLMAPTITLTHGVINIGSGNPVSLNAIIEIIRRHIPADVEYKNSRTFDVPSIALDVSYAKEIMGWEAIASLDEGILKMIFNSKR